MDSYTFPSTLGSPEKIPLSHIQVLAHELQVFTINSFSLRYIPLGSMPFSYSNKNKYCTHLELEFEFVF
ncbi:hypothetical protein CLU79DRAFT_744182 [Phycomyces nitens]|nr:hypothetical protein CLU79DRAFT_744182 [Phycomyces nitens]